MTARSSGDGRVLVDAAALAEATGWQLKPEGLCRGDVCVPVRDPRALGDAGGLDVAEVAQALGRPLVVDAVRGVAALGEAADDVASSMASLQAPDVVVADLDGHPVSLHDVAASDLGRRKRLLLAWSSW
jgi:hypothetical protein